MKTTFGLLISLLFSCWSFANFTELTPAGNEQAARIFSEYSARPGGCIAHGAGKRVLLSGFGLFQGIPFNPTGAIATNIALQWPAQVVLNEKASMIGTPASGIFPVGRGATVFNRQVTIGETKVELCVLVVDVLWDIAGAIIAHEMDRFQPDAVLMLGAADSASLEGGALNYAEFYEGYEADGSPSEINLPVKHPILPSQSVRNELPMRWNNEEIRDAVSPYLLANGIELAAYRSARSSNTYLCNHVSYVALAAAESAPLELAGGLIQIEPHITSNPRIGFFHIPQSFPLDKNAIETWGSLVTSVIASMID